ncbi:MAG: prepilin-type N-terminal cleavage/methylation domain-containing protein [Ketobacter sp.]|uniref:prepilin-type N-terminal cleavage/methylation domain-containing protein n=1 Tax=Ketobacter sp. MCCC 1A13808 TaxID=2602738 RepID=UPI0018DDC6D7|nr:prepilin-type N-terminal cleavage/methylation domain-containing protein [Ketobacter sp. MCCC 1A13808]
MKQPDNYFVEVDSRHFCIKPARDASRGFTLIELVVVIALIAILAAVALPRMLDTYDNAHEAAVFGVGGAMASAMILVRSQWVANGGSLAVDGVDGFGNDDIATSSDGWPTDAGMAAGSSHSAVLDSPERCVRLWRGVLVANAPSVSSSSGSGADYLVDTVSGNCRFTYQRSDRGSNIIYNARTGEVITTI